MRVFLIEPCLRRTESHYVEHTLAIYSYLRSRTDIESYVIGHKNLTETVMRLFPGVIAGISHATFEDLYNLGRSFYANLMELDRRFGFVRDDLILIPTAYENQILGAALLAERTAQRVPRIAIQFHQLYPPVACAQRVSVECSPSYWTNRLRRAFALHKHSQITYWTTESPALNAAYRRISKTIVKTLPVAYALAEGRLKCAQPPADNRLRIGFVGDGRREKGLMLFLRTCLQLNDTGCNLSYVFQLNNPRGFSSAEQLELEKELARFGALSNAEVIRGGLSPSQHEALVHSLDVIVLPYDPTIYTHRVSGIFIKAAIQRVVVVVPEKTWAAMALQKKRAAGAAFEYVAHDQHATETNIAKAILEVVESYAQLRRQAAERGKYYQSRCRPSNYLSKVLRHYQTTIASR